MLAGDEIPAKIGDGSVFLKGVRKGRPDVCEGVLIPGKYNFKGLAEIKGVEGTLTC